MTSYRIQTEAEGWTLITAQVQRAVENSGVKEGACLVYCPHTTAGITINENADPDVADDVMLGLNAAFPDREAFRHFEGNSAAHLKASVVGPSVMIPIREGHLALGRWQGIYFCEFDGPRARQYFVQVLKA